MYRQEVTKTVKVALYYNRRFLRPSRNLLLWEGSYTASFAPDYSISITVTEGAAVQKHWLHFDAKYRLEPAEVVQILHDSGADVMADADDDEIGYEQEISRLHRREDLFKMHTYRDGILGTRGAYILFPGDGIRATHGRQDAEFLCPASLRVSRTGRLCVSERRSL